MKIISQPGDWTHKITCTCKAVLEVEVNDFKFVSDPRDGNAVTCRCPVCHNEIWLNASIVPPHLQHKLR